MLLKNASLSSSLWEKAFTTTCYMQKRIYHRPIDAISYTLGFGTQPNYSNLHDFGSSMYFFVSPNAWKKLQDHIVKAILVGYGEPHGMKGYHLFNPTIGTFLFSHSFLFDKSALIPISIPNSHFNPQLLPTPNSTNIHDPWVFITH